MAPKMQYVRLGNSGLKVSKIILGCMSYGTPKWQGWILPEEEAIQHIRFAYDNGITSFDTANASAIGKVILGNAIKKLNLPRDELVIMTKLYAPVRKSYDTSFPAAVLPEDEGIINQRGLSRKHIFDSVQASLKRLQLDHIDLLQCHRFDYNTPIEETMQALHDVVQAGWVRYVGMSSCWAYQFHQMQNYAITHNLTPFISMQNHYSLLYREEEREMFPTLKMFGVGSIPFSPLARGVLTHPMDVKTTRSDTDTFRGIYDAAWLPDVVGRVEEIAKKKSASMAQIALAWTFAKPGVTAPIIGTTSLANLEDILGSLDVNLTEEEIKYLEEPYKPIATVGHT
ncbi:Aldo/keto reductase [Epithele typhae]|uniref:Aldo/keto reductase n=1 Tax=Epithele typhae TaxID=378194 RepID=UPI002007A571|nr:Aldo/keto reductase [Epithele typhae]KAH9925004.1 Aldo/keto reductase [Epithele typhae]